MFYHVLDDALAVGNVLTDGEVNPECGAVGMGAFDDELVILEARPHPVKPLNASGIVRGLDVSGIAKEMVARWGTTHGGVELRRTISRREK